MDQTPTRRDVLKALGALPAALSLSDTLAAQARPNQTPAAAPGANAQPTMAIVSRHLQWTELEEGAAVAAEGGFKAVAWTCRGGAHMTPENVERELPRAMTAARNAGLAVPMLITSINDATTPNAERVLNAMRTHGITRYRAPNFRYDYAKDMQAQWDALKPRVEALAKLNEKYGTTAMFHTHSSTGSVGGGLWDIWLLVRDLPSELVGINYDIGHSTVRGGTEWMNTARFAHRHIRALSLKDVRWSKRPNAAPGQWAWTNEFVVPGEGMVNYDDMFAYFKSVNFAGPMEVYFEYRVDIGNGQTMNMLGTNYGTWKLEMPKARFVSLLKRDTDFYRSIFSRMDWNVA